ncbi:MAG: zinc-ribbon domain-containing protein [Promethearchaeota archaeon]
MGKDKLFAYCDNCEKEIEKPKRKAIEGMYLNIWILCIIASLGFGLIPFLIYRYIILKKTICPYCQNELDFYNSREDIPEPKAQIKRILQTIEQEKDANILYNFCSLCGEKIEAGVKFCPNCGSKV